VSDDEELQKDVEDEITDSEESLRACLRRVRAQAELALTGLKIALKGGNSQKGGVKGGVARALLDISLSQKERNKLNADAPEIDAADILEEEHEDGSFESGDDVMQVSIEIVAVVGFNSQLARRKPTVSCRITCDNFAWVLLSETLVDSTVKFRPMPRLICADANQEEHKQVHIQVTEVHQGTGARHSLVETNLGTTSFYISELLAGDDHILSKPLTTLDSSAESSQYNLQVRSSWQIVKKSADDVMSMFDSARS
jgi:hypothetical protein